MDQYLVRPIDFRITEVADVCFEPHLRRPDSQNGGRNGQERRRGGETRVQIVWKRRRGSHLEPAIPVRHGAGVTGLQNLVLDFRLPSCGLVASFYNLREDVTMKTAAPQNEKPGDYDDNQ